MTIQAVKIGSTLDIKYHFKEKEEGLESIEKLNKGVITFVMRGLNEIAAKDPKGFQRWRLYIKRYAN